MTRVLKAKLDKYAKTRKARRKWLIAAASLCAAVALSTSYVLINPAETIVQETYCGIEEHKEHTDACYEKILVCPLSEEGHAHAETCYEEVQTLVCEIPETEGHLHTEACYEQVNYIVCELEETEGHVHDKACYETENVLICESTDEEHVHTEECYEEREKLICLLDECEPHHHDETCMSVRQVLICGEEETEPHTHSEACYVTETRCTCGMEECEPHEHTEDCYAVDYEHLVCELPIHEHTLQCFSDPNADVETAQVWTKTFSSVALTGNRDEDILAIAKTQIGYKESTRNYLVQEDGTTMKGYTRYGAWYGNPYGDWCAMFCSFCLRYAGVDSTLMPRSASCESWIGMLKAPERALYHRDDGYAPKPGDLIFFDWDSFDPENPDTRVADHVGFVAEFICDETTGEIVKVKTIEGNSGDCVRWNTYAVNDAVILGYGELPVIPAAVDEPEPDEEPAPDEESKPDEETEPESGSAELSPVTDTSLIGGHVYVTQGENGSISLSVSATALRNINADGFNEEGAGSTGVPLDVEDYIPSRAKNEEQAVILEYKEKGASEDAWTDVTKLGPNDTIPGDAALRLNIEFEKVNILDLQAAGYQMTFDLPDIMRDPIVSQIITSGTTEVGRLEIVDGVVVITFDQDWVDSQQKYVTDEDGTLTPVESFLNGDFWVRSEIDLTEAEEEYPGEVRIGDVDIYLNFEPDSIGKYGDVGIDKSNAVLTTDPDTGISYLTYTLRVEAGEDGCPDVSVKDIFGENEFTGAYELLGATKNGDPISTDGIATTETENAGTENEKITNVLNWPIGDMAPGDVYTLTYRVPLADGYVGGRAEEPLDNKATVYYGDEYEKSHDDTTFTPKTDVKIEKKKVSDASIINTEDGGYYVYEVTVEVPADTTYPLENVILTDALDGTIAGKPATDPEIRKHLSYDLTDDPGTTGDDSAWCTVTGNKATPVKDYEDEIVFSEDTDGDGKHNESFSVNLGTLNPGEKVTFRYKVKIEPGVFAELNDEDGTVHNTAGILLDGDKKAYKSSSRSDTITHKQWARKLSGEKTDSDINIPIGENDGVYNYGTPPVPADHPTGDSFTVPEGSYMYQVLVNEAGDWDVASASMTDAMQAAWMEYQGYVRVDAYPITKPIGGTTDEEVAANMAALTPSMTSWVKIEDLTSFSFKPSDVFTDENGKPVTGDFAYRLTYYAKPETDQVLNNVIVGNTFALSGEAVNGETVYTLVGVEAEADVVVQANTTFTAEKLPWYYTKEGPDGFNNGALYWVIKADGPMSAGTKFNDYTETTTSYYRSGSIEGVYKVKLGSVDLTSFESLSALKNAAESDENMSLEPVPGTAYSVDYYSSSGAESTSDPSTRNCTRAVITLNEDITLEPDESLYIIYRTDPYSVPTGNTGSKTYKNNLQTQIPGQDKYSDPQPVTQTVYSQEYLYKVGHLGEYYDRNDGKGLRMTWSPGLPDYGNLDINNGTTDGHSIETGTYVGWYIRLDQWDNMDGRYRVMDKIPEGLTPEFVGMITWDNEFTNGYGYHNREIPPEELPEGNWTKHVTVMTGSRKWYSGSSYSNASAYTFYWYTDEENNVLFDLENFNPKMTSGHDVQLMIGTRVADPDVLMHGKLGDYNNTVKLYDDEGKPIDQSSAQVSISKTTLEKKLTGESVNPLPFAITVNEMGEDLIPDVSTVTLVDTLSDNLTLDPASITVKNRLTGEVLPDTEWSAAVNGQTFSLTVPDGQPLVVTYNAYLNALPGEQVTVWNDAYWRGSTPPTTHTVIKEKYSYVAGGSAGADTPPQLEITKRDASNVLRTLSGVPFKVERMLVNETTGELTVDDSFTALTGETGTNGKLVFGSGALEVNTVYRITEVEAPEGYLLDEDPHYFIVAKKVNEEYPAFLSLLNTTNPYPYQDEQPFVALQYYEVEPKYAVSIYDPPIQYELPATGGSGTLPYTLFALLLMTAVVYGYVLRRKRERRAT